MRVARGWFIPVFFMILFSVLPQAALAWNATTLDVSAPSSVEVDEDFALTASYTSNGTSICGAACEVSGGWLGYTVFLTEGSGCIYQGTVSAYGSAGSYSPHVYCHKTFYDSQTEYFDIDITKKSSYVSLLISPPSPYPGDWVTVYAYYLDEDDYLIMDGSCTAELRRSGVYLDSVNLVRYGDGYYSGILFVPNEYGTYTIEVTCTSDEYDMDYSEKSFAPSKKRAYLTFSMRPVGYYGEFVGGTVYYRDENQNKIEGVCKAYFDDKVYVMVSNDLGYDVSMSIPYGAGPHILRITCESDAYQTVESYLNITAMNRPTRIEIISPVLKEFYPTDDIQLKISYTDTLSKSNILDASCVAQVGDTPYQMTESGNYYGAAISNMPVGKATIVFKCSKAFYTEASGNTELSIIRMPLNILFTTGKTDFRAEEEIKILAKVMDKSNRDADVACSARADVYDLSFNRLVNSKGVQATKTGGEWAMNVPNPGEPSRIVVTLTCSGEIFEEKSARWEVKIRMLGSQTEEGITLLLTVTTVILLALTFLIRKKLKII
jgi:hypothetical protein